MSLTNCNMDKKIIEKCFSLLTIGCPYGINDLNDIVERVENTLLSELFAQGFNHQKNLWLDASYETIKTTILDYIFEI